MGGRKKYWIIESQCIKSLKFYKLIIIGEEDVKRLSYLEWYHTVDYKKAF